MLRRCNVSGLIGTPESDSYPVTKVVSTRRTLELLNFVATRMPKYLLLSSFLFALPLPSQTTGQRVCTVDSLVSYFASVPSGPGSRSIGYTLSRACPLPAESSDPWIQVSVVPNGATGTLNITFQSNPNPFSRVGIIRFGNADFVITQSGSSCFYTITPGSRVAEARGEATAFYVRAPAGCSWTAVSEAEWIVVESGNSGSGDGVVKLRIAVNNTGVTRFGTVNVRGIRFFVTQPSAALLCVAATNDFIPPSIRAESLSERIGDLLFLCQVSPGGTPPPLTAVADLTMTLNATVTSRLLDANGRSEALLLATERLDNFNNTLTPLVPVLGANAFTGRVIGPNVIRWSSIPIGALYERGKQTRINPVIALRFTNVRVDGFSFLFSPDLTVDATLEIKSTTPVTFDDVFATQPLAALTFAYLDYVNPPVQVGLGVYSTLVEFLELDNNAFRPRIAPGQENSHPETYYYSESGFVDSRLGDARIGEASQGTRLTIRLENIPAGVQIQAPSQSPNRAAKLISANASGAGGTIVNSGFLTTYHNLPVTGGVATATYEIFASDPFNIEYYPIELGIFTSSGTTAFNIANSITTSFAPRSAAVTASTTAPIPRGIDLDALLSRVNLRAIPGVQRAVAGTQSAKSAKHEVVGSNRRFSYTFVNDSSEPATATVVRGNAPSGFTYTGCTRLDNGQACTYSGSEMTANLGTLGPGKSAAIELTVASSISIPDGTYVENTVAVSSEVPDVDVLSNSASSGFRVENCTAVDANRKAFTSTGGGATISLSGCGVWTVVSGDEWLVVAAASSGTNAGTVNFTVAANPNAVPRSGSIYAGGSILTVTQEASCSYAITTPNVSAGPGVFTGSINVLASPGCAWTAASNQPWLTIGGYIGSGNAPVPYNVAANTGTAQRQAKITVAGKEFTYTQAGVLAPPSCVASVTPTTGSAAPAQTAGRFSINTNTGCNWTASSSASWLEIYPLSGTNSGAIDWTAYPNFGTKTRTATVTVGDKTFTVTQTARTETLMQRYVRLLYFSYLGRGATDAEVNGQVNSGLSRTQLATNFLNSPEFNIGGRFTAGLYIGLINRDAEFTGWQFQRQALARGAVNQDDLVSNFLTSAEFALKFGVLTDAAFVRLMYKNILGREATPTEVGAWVNVLAELYEKERRKELKPGSARTIVSRSFLNSPEFQTGTGPRLIAFLLYATLLLRDGTPQERAGIELQLPAQLQALLNSFANGAEINTLLQ
jgi:hypothetical protein